MTEPARGQGFLKMMNSLMAQHDLVLTMTPILADVFVFSYPIYLLVLYFYGVGQKKDYYKNASLFLFFAGFASVFVNLIIQRFISKVRPDVVLELFVENREALFLEHLPKDTFPSDHAAMGAAIAMVTLLRGLKHKDRVFVWLSLPFVLFAVLMGLSRITAGIHWPTDIIAGTLVGVLVSLLFFQKNIFARWEKHVFAWINMIADRVLKFLKILK